MVALNDEIINEVFMKKTFLTSAIVSLVLMNIDLASAESMPQGHHHEMPAKSVQAMHTIKLSVEKIETKGKTRIVVIRLSQLQNGKPLTLDELKEVHTEKVHLLIINDTLDDYSHVHPVALTEPGLYQFEWTPKKQGAFRIWADLVPLSTNSQEYAIADLTQDKVEGAAIDKSTQMESTVNDYHFRLVFENPDLVAGKAVMGSVMVTDSKGNPVTWLEPIMGAYAHIVGFSQDRNTVVHIHPMGIEPKTPTDKGGPMLKFHLEPEQAGFVKLFVQVRINGKEIIAPFAFTVGAMPDIGRRYR